MSAAKHTRGPWEFLENALVGPKIDDKPIWLRPVILRSEVGVAQSDARLIAAAPDLLEALINQMAATYALLEWATQVADEYLDGDPGARAALVSDLETARKHANEARSAIAKATGSTS